jgi:alkylation response protein AidB-like acyl-CoA dehydrogenase
VSDLLARAEAFLLDHVAPRANEIDADPDALREVLNGLCEQGFMGLRRPAQYGGPEVDETTFRVFQEAVARRSGSLAFLQTQHQSAVSMIAKWGSEELKQRILPHVHGDLLIGIGFSQLRRSGPPILTAQPTDEGYLLNGEVPWVTGYGFFQKFLIGAALPDGSSLFGLVPFARQEGFINFEGPMRLAAMESPQTMTATLTNWLMTHSQMAFIQPPRWIHENDLINVALQAWFALGCARAGLDLVDAAYGKRRAEFLRDAWSALDQELELCRGEILANHPDVSVRLAARAWAIDLAARCAHAGVVASSGAANSMAHSAQRVYREALVYSVSAQTTEIMEATLHRLVQRGTVER